MNATALSTTRPSTSTPAAQAPKARKPGTVLSLLGVTKPNGFAFATADQAKAAKDDLESIAFGLERVANASGRNSRRDAIERLTRNTPCLVPDNLSCDEAKGAAELARSWSRQAGGIARTLGIDFAGRRATAPAPKVVTPVLETEDEREKRLAAQRVSEAKAVEKRQRRHQERLANLGRQDYGGIVARPSTRRPAESAKKGAEQAKGKGKGKRK